MENKKLWLKYTVNFFQQLSKADVYKTTGEKDQGMSAGPHNNH